MCVVLGGEGTSARACLHVYAFICMSCMSFYVHMYVSMLMGKCVCVPLAACFWHESIPVSILECVSVSVCVAQHAALFPIEGWEASDASPVAGGRDSAGQVCLPPPTFTVLLTPAHSLLPFSLLALAQALGTYKVLRPLRPRNMRPCTVSSWFPVSISSCTPAAPSKAPSLTSLILLLLRFLERGGGVGQDRRRQGITAPKVRTGWWGAQSQVPGHLSSAPVPGVQQQEPQSTQVGYLCENRPVGCEVFSASSSFSCPGD